MSASNLNQRIFTSHGLVDSISTNQFSHRGLIDRIEFERYLHRRNEPFKSLSRVLEEGGEALTIDDATNASADAAFAARSLGHDVTLFINPGYIDSQSQYPLYLLNFLLDEVQEPFSFDGIELNNLSYQAKKDLRKIVKRKINSISDHQRQNDYLELLADSVRVRLKNLPRHLSVITLEVLLRLSDSGIRIENHGHWHMDTGVIGNDAAYENARLGKEWLHTSMNLHSRFYAVPFGDASPSPDIIGLCDACFLLDSSLKTGFVGRRVFNREKLRLMRPYT